MAGIASEETAGDMVMKSADMSNLSMHSSTGSSPSATSTRVRQTSGRAGMIRTSTAPSTVTTSNVHSRTGGRGHNPFQILVQNYKPFLDSMVHAQITFNAPSDM